MSNPPTRHILVVLDRSGSMENVRTDTEGGLRAFLAEQAASPSTDVVTLVQFDCEIETVFSVVPLANVPEFRLAPRSSTALLDAIGTTINGESARVAALAEADRPDETVVVILTDGAENASREYTLTQIEKLIGERRDEGWVFVFLGADQDAFAVSGRMGIDRDTTLSYSGRKTTGSMRTAGTMISRGSGGGSYTFTDDERAQTMPESESDR
ncbi:hypothetical protein B4N89_27530 [Embleya scabrispora]|uniref:Uncharacterized protein n=1 Tax=Embleya scabrispora TaxID=159449 RepID=A0A1T3P511_9ACTN|nr:vWA domain-containing protein [Embleya scabrispora]OPC84179.1 hypothetical protein B4N89_27530 [Embleya scabrispora]